MFYIGIDVASEKHDCCILSADRSPVCAFSFENDRNGFTKLLRFIQETVGNDKARIGMEATGVYGENLLAFLRRKGFEVLTYNPLAIKKRMSATTLRKTKTDKADAAFIALLLTQDDFQTDPTSSYHTSEVKSLSRGRFSLIKSRTAAKNQAKTLLAVLFPEYHKHFSDVFGASSLALLRKYPSAKDIAACRPSALAKLLNTASRGRLGEDKAREVIQAAKGSIGRYCSAIALELQYLLAQISLANEHVARFDAAIKAEMDRLNSPILTVPGIGYTLGAMILGEIGDIHRFSSAAKLLAFAGMEPSIYQSGKYTPSSGSMVKRGSPYLRWALMQAARLISTADPTFHAYLDKKRSEGKHFTVALSHTAKKLVRTLFAVLHNNSRYSLNYSLIPA